MSSMKTWLYVCVCVYVCSLAHTHCYSYLWCAIALLERTTRVKMAKAALWIEWAARAKPAHSVISPKKLAPDTYWNTPPMGENDTDIWQGILIISYVHWK